MKQNIKSLLLITGLLIIIAIASCSCTKKDMKTINQQNITNSNSHVGKYQNPNDANDYFIIKDTTSLNNREREAIYYIKWNSNPINAYYKDQMDSTGIWMANSTTQTLLKSISGHLTASVYDNSMVLQQTINYVKQ